MEVSLHLCCLPTERWPLSRRLQEDGDLGLFCSLPKTEAAPGCSVGMGWMGEWVDDRRADG